MPLHAGPLAACLPACSMTRFQPNPSAVEATCSSTTTLQWKSLSAKLAWRRPPLQQSPPVAHLRLQALEVALQRRLGRRVDCLPGAGHLASHGAHHHNAPSAPCQHVGQQGLVQHDGAQAVLRGQAGSLRSCGRRLSQVALGNSGSSIGSRHEVCPFRPGRPPQATQPRMDQPCAAFMTASLAPQG